MDGGFNNKTHPVRISSMRDFTLDVYKALCGSLKNSGYSMQSVAEYFENPASRVCLIRHDVDSWPSNALQMAEIEHDLGIKASYYFRQSPISVNEAVIKRIVMLGHEIGYHYEDLAETKGDFDAAIKRFKRNLDFFRFYYPVTTIAMHGRPLSPWDSKALWEKYDYREYGIIAEPYLDLDFQQMAYFTDTGNCWDGDKYSVRDHVSSPYKFSAHFTWDLIDLISSCILPQQVMLNIHPARWNDNPIKWLVRYYILTYPKYMAKKALKKYRNSKGKS